MPCQRRKLLSVHYVAGLIDGMRALGGPSFQGNLKIVAGNPCDRCEPPKTEKLPVKFADADQVEHFGRTDRGIVDAKIGWTIVGKCRGQPASEKEKSHKRLSLCLL